MRRAILKNLEKNYVPRWLILANDLVMVCSMYFFTYLLRYNLETRYVETIPMLWQMLAGLPFFFAGALIFKPHYGIIRHSTTNDALSVIKSQLVLSSGFLMISLLGREFDRNFMIPYSVIIVHFFVSVSILTFIRFAIKYIYNNLLSGQNEKTNILIFGAGETGSNTRNMIENDVRLNYEIIGFIDDNPKMRGKSIGGTRVFSSHEAFGKVIQANNVKEVILAIPAASITIERKREIAESCISNYLKIKEIPDPATWIEGKLYSDQIRSINIEDLLGREPIKMNTDLVMKGIKGKKVLVTGGAGSIGSEIVRQLIYLQPKSISIIDMAESPLFNLQMELTPLLHEIELNIFVEDVTDSMKMREIFNRIMPEIIYHASAYKHVPLMELQPYTAIKNNIGGTKTIADLALETGVGKFVMISTDKAVNPTNVMGTTKRICEIYIQSLSQKKGHKTEFITTRFGNVLGSNGSVIPLFKKQIDKGGPVTVTHKEIIRYFMTIPEACQLVLEAGFMGKGGEIYLFDMGDPVRIYDLAEKMISLAGFIPHKEIKIVETGLRPGEKLYEELMTGNEDTLPTNHKKIMIGKIRPYDHEKALDEINGLLSNLSTEDETGLVARMKKIVPEFISNNSQFEVLDNK